jgi:hypothetical protein
VSGLYTVTMTRLHLVSRFDADGKVVSRETKKIPITFCDLPYSTACMYLSKGEKGEFQMVEQLHERAPGRKKYRDREVHLDFKNEAIAPSDLGSEDAEEAKSIMEAAMTGDMAAAVNAELEAS